MMQSVLHLEQFKSSASVRRKVNESRKLPVKKMLMNTFKIFCFFYQTGSFTKCKANQYELAQDLACRTLKAYY